MPLRTFDIDCSHETAANELPMPFEQTIKVGSYHPLMANGSQVVLCVHDDEDHSIAAVPITKRAVEHFEGRDDEFVAHLERILNSESN